MGVVQELIGALRDFNHIGDDIMEDTVNRKRYSSISKRSLEGIMQFPALVSQSIDIDTLQMVTKALEKQYASFAQTAISMSPFLNLNKDKDAAGYLRKFHQNSTRGNVRDDVLNLFAYTDVKESFNVFADELDTMIMFTAVGEGNTGAVVMANRKGLVDTMEGLRMDTVNDKFIPNKHRRITDNFIRRNHVNEATSVNNATIQGDQHVDTIVYNVKGPSGNPVGKGPLNLTDHKLPNRVLQDNDVKKANELVPTTMHIRTTLLTATGDVAGNLDFIAGVKTTMHPVTSNQMVTNIADGLRGSGKFFKFVRWSTGEIAFARDYLFNLTEIREDVLRTRDRNSKWFTALKRRKRLAKFKRTLFLPGELLPNASIVLSIEEVDFIKREYGFDMLEPNVADKLMREFFLINVTVVDAAAQVCHFLFDGQEDFQTVTFTGLERGDLNGGNNINFKDVLKLVQRS